MLKFNNDILKFSNESIFYRFFKYILLHIYILFIYIKMSKNLSAKYYQENKQRLQQKSLRKISQPF